MQRLFSTFPIGRPGVGLLLFRLALACMILMHVPGFGSATWQLLSMIACIGVSILLAFGFLTPLACLAGIAVGGARLVTGEQEIAADLTLMVSVLSLALIGPGAYSIDARLYGRREIVLARKLPPHPE